MEIIAKYFLTYIVDYVIILCCTYFIWRGYHKGFLRSVIGPVSLMICTALAYFHYQKNEDLKIALLLASFGPFLLALILNLFLFTWNKMTKEKEEDLSQLSRFIGGLFHLIWKGSFMIIVIYLLTLLPAPAIFPWISTIQEKIYHSNSYLFIQSITKNRLPTAESVAQVTKTINDPKKIIKIKNSEEYQALMGEEDFIEFIEDEEIKKMVEEKNMAKLISHPKIRSLLNNKELMKNILKMNAKILSE
ncbi:MAG: CvpA family protein [Candidatus Omnitrophica bacterium]|nr:CvpA family protein [Candidatus Omnitrophota bacterium]